jgi:hypothetical protein
MHPTLVFYCLTPDDFTRQVESAATQWVKPHVRCHSYVLEDH